MAGANTDSLGIPSETLNSVDMTEFDNSLITLTKITNEPLFDQAMETIMLEIFSKDVMVNSTESFAQV